MKKYEFWVLSFLFLVFSFWLMFSTFSYSNGQFRIASKVWSDFGAAIPLIRSFSKGVNWPPQHPLFPGEPIRYHYLFYLGVGLLEKAGVRIDLALNVLSSLGFFSLLSLIYILAKRVTQENKVAVLAVILFLFNSSLTFVDYFHEQGFSIDSLKQIPYQTEFSSFAPWKNSQVAAFWNLNIYTNQRHLAPAFAIVLLIIIMMMSKSKKKVLLVGPLLAMLLSFNQAAFVIAVVYVFFIVLSDLSLLPSLLISGLLGIPFLYPFLFMSHAYIPMHKISGFLYTHSPLRFWIYNLGLSTILIPISFLKSDKKNIPLILATITIFVIANSYQLSTDVINNHKLINFAVIIGNIFTASVLAKIKNMPILIFILLILTSGGILDLFPVINDYKILLADAPTNQDIVFFESLPKKSLVLNSLWFYHPASLAGIPIFNGYSYFTWSYGYDQVKREHQTKQIYAANDRVSACKLLQKSGITHVELSSRHEGFLAPNNPMWQNDFVPIYSNQGTGLKVYSVADSCQI